MPDFDLLPADKRDAILAELANVEPMTNALVLNGITKGTIGLRAQRRMLDMEAALAASERTWEYGFRVIDRPGASVHPDGIGEITWLGSEEEAREFAPRWMREWRYSSRTSRAEIVRRRAAGEVEVVTADEIEASDD